MTGWLLDTHILLWWQNNSKELSEEIREIIASPQNVIHVSAATIWEMSIKSGLGKLVLPADWQTILADEPFEKLAITFQHACEVSALPLIHQDPFDRMLVAQARCESLTLITHDEEICRYDVSVQKA